MKNKIFIMASVGILALGGVFYGISTTGTCLFEGTAICSKVDCPLAGTSDCPFEKGEMAECCKKK